MEEVFIKNTRRIMGEKGIDHKELAKLCNVPTITIERILNNKTNIGLHTAVMIANALEMSLDVLCKV